MKAADCAKVDIHGSFMFHIPVSECSLVYSKLKKIILTDCDLSPALYSYQSKDDFLSLLYSRINSLTGIEIF